MPKRLDLTGKVIGKLTVLCEAGQDDRGNYLWECLCSCGTTWVGSAARLGYARSCGCVRGRQLPRGEAALNVAFSKAQWGASKRGLAFDLDRGQFRKLSEQPCHYCGEPPSQRTKFPRSNGDFVRNGIDRVDNEEGYMPINCVPCCAVCNKLKGTLALDFFVRKINQIHDHLRSKETQVNNGSTNPGSGA